jgi:hypothetical protein
VLVDPKQQRKRVEENDPQEVLKIRKRVTDEQIADALKTAFSNGLFTLSEIAFDDNHERALVAYSFVCGGLCGNGGTLMLEKAGLNWKVKNVCGAWIA